VFAGEVLVVVAILFLTRRIADVPAEHGVRLDLVGAGLSAIGLGLIVFGVLRGGDWGFVRPKPDAPSWLGVSPSIWLVVGGIAIMRGFLGFERRRITSGAQPLINPPMLQIRTLRGGLIAFLLQYLLQAGVFFCVPLYLSVSLGLSAVATGVRLLPLSITLLLAAVGIPKLLPDASPRRIVQVGFASITLGIMTMVAALDAGAGPEIVTWPMLLVGFGIGALASQLGSVTVSAVPDEQAGEVGGLQNTVTNLGASIGTALAGAVLISALTGSFVSGIQNNPQVPAQLKTNTGVELAAGVPFVSDADVRTALSDANVPPATADAIVDENSTARLDGLRAALSVLAIIGLLGLFSRRLPSRQPGAMPPTTDGTGREDTESAVVPRQPDDDVAVQPGATAP
jgi:hypothetical protein